MSDRAVRLRNVQAMRGIAALGVVGAHLGDPHGFEAKWLAGGHHWMAFLHRPGQVGVDLFFVISGLIMTVTTSGLSASAAHGRRFMLRRLTRIYPAYWVATLPIVMLFLAAPGMVNSTQERPPRILESLLLLPQPGLPLLLVGWTLTFEIYFYVIFALTLLLPGRLRPPAMAGWGAITAGLAVLFAGTDNPWLNLVSAPICLEFLFGAVVGWLMVRGRFMPSWSLTALAITAALVAIAVGGSAFPGTWYRAVPVGLLVAVMVYGLVSLEVRDRFTAPAPLQRLGDASYSMYLWHVLILTALGRFIWVRLPDQTIIHAAALLVSVAAVLICSQIAYLIIERPLLRVLQNLISRPAQPDQPDQPAGDPPHAHHLGSAGPHFTRPDARDIAVSVHFAETMTMSGHRGRHCS